MLWYDKAQYPTYDVRWRCTTYVWYSWYVGTVAKCECLKCETSVSRRHPNNPTQLTCNELSRPFSHLSTDSASSVEEQSAAHRRLGSNDVAVAVSEPARQCESTMSSSGIAPSINTNTPPSSSPPLTASSPTASASPTSLLSPQGRISLRSTSALSRDRYSQVSEQREEERRKSEERERREREDRERKDRETQQQLQRDREKESRERDKERDRGGGRERHERGDRQRRDDGRQLRGGERERDRDRKDRHDVGGSDDRRDRDRDRDRQQHDGRDNRDRDRDRDRSSSSSFTARRTATNSNSNTILRITPSSLAPSSTNPAPTSTLTTVASPIDLSPSLHPPTTAVSNTSTTPHPLAHTWCLYFDRRTAKNKALPPPPPPTAAGSSASSSYENSLQLVSTFDTAEQLLALLHYLVLPSALDFNSNYHLFRLGVRPIWEDESNEKGGKWVAKSSNAGTAGRVDGWWVRLLLRVVGETLGEDEDGGSGDVVDDVNGCVFSRRRQGDRIAVWNRSRDEGRIKALGAAIKHALTSGGGGGQVQLAYDLHEDSMKAGSSYSNASRYTM